MSSTTTAPQQEEPYTGSCHCKSFVYTFRHAPLTGGATPVPVATCNCSICISNGYLFIYPSNSSLTFSSGDIDSFSKYFFHTKRVAHYFCPTCGTSCMARSTDPIFDPVMLCINVRTLAGVDLKALTLKELDGASFNMEDPEKETVDEGKGGE